MIHCKVEELYTPRYAALWALLSFKAGLLNASGFLMAGNYVSHVTGFGTQIGIAIGHADYLLAPIFLLVPLSFIVGASVPAWILDVGYHKNIIPKYPLVQAFITVLLGLIAWLATTQHFGPFADGHGDLKGLALVGLLCLTCGLKNGLTTWATHGKIRTTHLTGLATDIGLHIPKSVGASPSSRYPEPKVVNLVRVTTLISFSIGSCISAVIYPKVQGQIFLIAFILSVGLLIISAIHYRNQTKKLANERNNQEKPHENFVQANSGTTQSLPGHGLAQGGK